MENGLRDGGERGGRKCNCMVLDGVVGERIVGE